MLVSFPPTPAIVQPPLLLIAAVAGVLSHVLYFNRGEHHMWAMRYIQAFLVGSTASVFFLVRVANHTTFGATKLVAAYSGTWLAGVYASLIVYRAFLHPLNKFPGPFAARISGFWYSSKLAGNAQAHKYMLKLHRQYGDYVRIGPSDLSIAHHLGPKAVYGHGTKCTKAAWYDNDAPLTSMHTSRNRMMHDQRRRIWSPAFSDKALRGYEDRIRGYGDKLVTELSNFGGKPVNVSKWFNYYSFDVMGDLAFGESFSMLDKGEEHWAIQLLNEGMEPLHMYLPPWFFRLLTAIPGLAAGYWKFIKYCGQKLDERISRDGGQDIISVLIEPYKKAGKPQGMELSYLQGDSRLIIVAGSDTTAATLTHLFYLLAKNPEYLEKIRNETRSLIDSDGDVKNKDLQDLPVLNGAINESMRLYPPVPSTVPRITPPEGIEVAGTHIPGGMTVWCPQYVIGRSDAAYPDALKFWPERWDENTNGVVEKTSFAPFSLGVYGCIGKPLALLELRTVSTKIINAFDIDLAPNETGHGIETLSRDHFTTGLADLDLTFKKRS